MERKVDVEVEYSDWKEFKKYSRLQGSNTDHELCKFIKLYNVYSAKHKKDFDNKVFEILDKNISI
ncbi:MAG TPA: hypothetical protein VJ907_08325 [Halanaerobiales bacterium]|nr:hypothetical protein [Halanaerobiales bacterium]